MNKSGGVQTALVILALIPNFSFATALTRDNVVSNCSPYSTVQVTLSTTNLLSPQVFSQFPGQTCDYRYPGVICTGTFIGETYKWGGFTNTSTFQTDVSPGNKKVVANSALDSGGIRDQQNNVYTSGNFTGLDCSGLVLRAWGISDRTGKNTAWLAAKTLPVPWNQLKRGDIFVRSQDMGDNTHTVLVSQDISGASASIIHATSRGFSRGGAQWRAISESVPLSCPDDYNCYLGSSRLMATGSPFPQFSDFTPADGAVIGSSRPAVSATIRSATTIDQNPANLQIKIDGNAQTGLTISGSGGLVTISGTASSTLSDGNHTMTVTARTYDTASGLDLSDVSSGLDFTIDTGSPSGGDDGAGGSHMPPFSAVSSTYCFVSTATSSGSGISSISAFGQTATFSCPMSARFGPFCNLAAGTYTSTTTSCSGAVRESTRTITSGSYGIRITANPPPGGSFTNFGAASSASILSGQLTVKACQCFSSGDCNSCTANNGKVYAQLTVTGGSNGCETGPCCCTTVSFGRGSPNQSFAFTNATDTWSGGEGHISAGLDGSGPVVTMTPAEFTINPGQSTNGTVELSEVGQKYPISGGQATSNPPFSGPTISSQTCDTSASLLAITRLLRPSLTCHNYVGSEAVFTSTAALTFTYPDASADTTTLRIYRFSDVGWDSSTITNQTVSLDTTTSIITLSGEVTRTGLFAGFFDGHDSSAPITTLGFQGSTYAFAGTVFASTDAYIVLTSTDPTVNGYASGVATTSYRIDPSTSSDAFTVYTASIPAPLGRHVLEYKSVDYAGNVEAIKTSTFIVTAGTVFTGSGAVGVQGDLLAGFLDYGVAMDVQSRAENDYTLRISSPNMADMLNTTNIGQSGVGVAVPGATLDIGGNWTTGLSLRNGNSIASTASVQIAFGYNGSAAMRHALTTTHSTNTVGNRMDFLVWGPLFGSSMTIANLDVLALQASTTTSGGLFHVRPVGNPALGVEVAVSNGSSYGGGTVRRGSTASHSSRRIKQDIRYLSAEENVQTSDELMRLKHVNFRYKSRGSDGKLVRDVAQPLGRGLIYEDAPPSIRGPGGSISLDARIANLEIALKEAMKEFDALQSRLKELEAPR